MKHRTLGYVVLALMLCWPDRASADLSLSFSQASYTIYGIGSSVDVPVYLSQSAGGPQVGVGNELLTAGLTVSFNTPSGIAAVLSALDITPSPAFDSSSAAVSLTQATLAETSLGGVSNLSSPLLLGHVQVYRASVGHNKYQRSDADAGAVVCHDRRRLSRSNKRPDVADQCRSRTFDTVFRLLGYMRIVDCRAVA